MSFLLPYILVPIILMAIWRGWHLPAKGLAFLITILLLTLYPSIVIRLEEYRHPTAPEEGLCLMFDTVITMVHYVVLMPLSLILQLILFAIFVREKVVKE